MTGCGQSNELHLPSWVPKSAGIYLQHTLLGTSIRSVARSIQSHPSTVLRQIRRLEAMRDDPLVDAALSSLENSPVGHAKEAQKEFSDMPVELAEAAPQSTSTLPQSHFDEEGLPVLRRLCEPGAILAVARDMESAVVVREDSEGQSIRTAVVERAVAQAMALRSWISSSNSDARIVRYSVTAEGRRAFRELTANQENNARLGRDQPEADPAAAGSAANPRYIVVENPILSLSRRKDKNGKPFISKEQLSAGEHLRQDYELSGLSVEDLQLAKDQLAIANASLPKGVTSARQRLKQALDDLGPGLAEAAFECCCLQRGLEVTEKKMGWSSRSGKIVLRIALTRLLRHYHASEGKFAPLIG